MSDLVKSSFTTNIAVLTLSAPEKRNAISVLMRQQVITALQKFIALQDCRAIILTGAAGYFCAGGDLGTPNGEISAPNPQKTLHNITLLHNIIRLIAAGPKPVIAAVEGGAYGAGLSLMAACDYVVATATARFGASFGKIGLMPDAGLLWSLPQRVGQQTAKELMLTSRNVQANEALNIGLVDRLVPEGEALTTAIEEAGKFSLIAPLAMAATKAVLVRGPQSLESILAAEAEMQPQLTLSDDYQEGRAAFTQRRQPTFRGV